MCLLADEVRYKKTGEKERWKDTAEEMTQFKMSQSNFFRSFNLHTQI